MGDNTGNGVGAGRYSGLRAGLGRGCGDGSLDGNNTWMHLETGDGDEGDHAGEGYLALEVSGAGAAY